MPTNRPRHSITESDEIAGALADAARRWPEDAASPTRLLLRLVWAGHAVTRREVQLRDDGWQEIVRETSGVLTGAYPEGYLRGLRSDWDE